MKKITIGGVPEHFNYPWYLTLKNKAYQQFNINLRWIDYPEGTGAMCEALRNKDLDMAVILTEGITKDIIDGNPSKIIQKFVGSPLNWGIHVAAKSKFQKVADLRGKKAAISRYGSGSHLMAFVNAQTHGWNLQNDLQFEVVDNIDNAVKALSEGIADYFMWEMFMTKPFVDQGIFRKIGVCPTPWPCFVIAANDNFIDENSADIQSILETINNCTQDFKNLENIDKIISQRYGLKIEDVRAWLDLTEWSQKQISSSKIEEVQQTLNSLGIVNKQLDTKDLLF